MKLNIANPATGQQKLINLEDERLYRVFYDKRMSQEVPADSVGAEFKGYIFRITGGNDKQGFPMKQGVLLPHRVKLLLSKGSGCYRPRRDGERRRKSVRGCIVGPDISVLAVVIVKQGDADIPGLTDSAIPKQWGPKRATKIRRLFNLTKQDDVRKYVVRKVVPPKNPDHPNAKTRSKAPKIQRLVTPMRLQRKRRLAALQKRKRLRQSEQKAEYDTLMSKRVAEKKEAAANALAHKKSDSGKSEALRKEAEEKRKKRAAAARVAYRAARKLAAQKKAGERKGKP